MLTGSIDDTFGSASKIHSIQVLRLKNDGKHSQSALLDVSFVLVVTGLLHVDGFGNASAVTYDGSRWTPLFLSTKDDGDPGTITTLFSELETNFNTSRARLARGLVILISLAIALALVFLIVVCGVLTSYVRRRREGYVPAPTMASAEKSARMLSQLPPEELFAQGRGGDRL